MNPAERQGSEPASVDLSIIIVNWNTRDLLEQCLQSVFAHPPQADFEVFVVDNASSDGSARLVGEHYPHVHLIGNLDNVGFARANNQAIREAHGRWVLLLNSDTVIRADALDPLIGFMDAHPEAGMVGANLVNPFPPGGSHEPLAVIKLSREPGQNDWLERSVERSQAIRQLMGFPHKLCNLSSLLRLTTSFLP